jgi:phosphonate transport system substrate-binding protein
MSKDRTAIESSRGRPARLLPGLVATIALTISLVACGNGDQPSAGQSNQQTLTISAIPDQDPEKLQRLYGTLADYLSDRLDINVEYKPVSDYPAALSLFRLGDLEMVWFGGLTGVQARLQTPGAQALVQRDIDEAFHSVFIVNSSTGLNPVTDGAQLTELKGTRFTFGSESSTSGRLMPQHFLTEAGVDVDTDFEGPAGFSGSHDKVIALVEAGSYQAGAVNEQVWAASVASGAVDTNKVKAFYVTPAFHDYHWIIHPDTEKKFGAGFSDRVAKAFTDLDGTKPEQKAILDLFGAARFIPTEDGNYAVIEQVGRASGLIKQ